MPPKLLQTLLIWVALLALGAAVYIGSDLYAGLTGSGFTLVRGEPVTPSDGLRYKLAILGESIAVLLMLGCSGLMLKIRQQLWK